MRSRHPEDYPLYLEGCDLASFDIYPVTHEKPDVRGKLWLVPFGVQRLREWSGDTRARLELPRVHAHQLRDAPEPRRGPGGGLDGARRRLARPHLVRPRVEAEASASGACSKIREMLEAVTALNHEILAFAEVLNAPTVPAALRVTTIPADVPIGCLLKRTGRTKYLFAINQRPTPVRAAFELTDGTGRHRPRSR